VQPGNTPLHLAALHGQLIAAHTLLQAATPPPAGASAGLFDSGGESVARSPLLPVGAAGDRATGAPTAAPSVPRYASIASLSLLAAPAAADTMTPATLCRNANHAGETPLHVAARWGFADMVTLLAAYHPAALKLADARGRTPADVRGTGGETCTVLTCGN